MFSLEIGEGEIINIEDQIAEFNYWIGRRKLSETLKSGEFWSFQETTAYPIAVAVVEFLNIEATKTNWEGINLLHEVELDVFLKDLAEHGYR